MRSIKPTGSLSRKNAYGATEPHNSWGGHTDFVMELNAFKAARLDDLMPESAQRMAYSAIKSLISKGEYGTLQFRDQEQCNESVHAEADTIKRRGCEYMIELRQPHRTVQKARFGQPARVMRLYYFEPDAPFVDLCGLLIASKPADEADMHKEQDDSISSAAGRAMNWFQAQIEKSREVILSGNENES